MFIFKDDNIHVKFAKNLVIYILITIIIGLFLYYDENISPAALNAFFAFSFLTKLVLSFNYLRAIGWIPR